MSENITVRYRWTKEEVTRAARWHFRQGAPRKVRMILLWAGVILLLAAGIGEYLRAGLTSTASWAFVGAAYFAFLLILLRYLTLWAVRRNFAKSASRDTEIEWTILDDRVRISNAHSVAESTWQAFIKAVQTPDGVLLYPQPIMFHWLPKNAFANTENYEAAVWALRNHVANFRQIR